MTDSSQIRHAAIAQLAQSEAQRSYTSQIREVYDAIEDALTSGVSRTAIHRKLVETGLTISLRHFDQALYRIRKSKKSASAAKVTSPNKVVYSSAGETGSSKPGTLKKEKEKSQGSFRQNLKQIREEVENTNWAEIINNPKESDAS